MKLRTALVAGKAIISREDNTVSLINVIEGVHFSGVSRDTPADTTVVHPMYFVAFYEDPTEEEKNTPSPADFWLETPLGPKLQKSISVDFEGSRRSRTIVAVYGVPFAGDGVYTFCMRTSDGTATWPIEVHFEEESDEPSEEPVPLAPLFRSDSQLL